MSIKVNSITKLYGTQKALDSVSFEVQPGEIVGFLGPNGAGKSTCMKILTSFVPPDSGRASVAGFDVESDSLDLRKKVGYLPEQNPLYLDMYIKEFLFFVGRIHGLNGIRDRVEEMIEMTGLELEQKKKIGSLSKGYRQRVGLAQAMIHDPEVLILDEPTAGLDPNQLVEIRDLIKNFGVDKTVLFSSHIMQEVQAICDRVIIINKGCVVADDRIDMLSKSRQENQIIRVKIQQVDSPEMFNEIDGLTKAIQKGEFYELFFSKEESAVETIFKWAQKKNLTVLHMEQVESSLEDVFQMLTKDA